MDTDIRTRTCAQVSNEMIVWRCAQCCISFEALVFARGPRPSGALRVNGGYGQFVVSLSGVHVFFCHGKTNDKAAKTPIW